MDQLASLGQLTLWKWSSVAEYLPVVFRSPSEWAWLPEFLPLFFAPVYHLFGLSDQMSSRNLIFFTTLRCYFLFRCLQRPPQCQRRIQPTCKNFAHCLMAVLGNIRPRSWNEYSPTRLKSPTIFHHWLSSYFSFTVPSLHLFFFFFPLLLLVLLLLFFLLHSFLSTLLKSPTICHHWLIALSLTYSFFCVFLPLLQPFLPLHLQHHLPSLHFSFFSPFSPFFPFFLPPLLSIFIFYPHVFPLNYRVHTYHHHHCYCCQNKKSPIANTLSIPNISISHRWNPNQDFFCFVSQSNGREG